MSDVRSELGDVVKVSDLSGGMLVRPGVQGERQWLVVCQNVEPSAFNEMPPGRRLAAPCRKCCTICPLAGASSRSRRLDTRLRLFVVTALLPRPSLRRLWLSWLERLAWDGSTEWCWLCSAERLLLHVVALQVVSLEWSLVA